MSVVRRASRAGLVATGALAFVSNASAAPLLTPSTIQAGDVQTFTLAVQPDPAKSGKNIPVERVELFVPSGFTVDSFAPTPEWEQDWTIQSVQKATWSREKKNLDNEHEREEFSEHDAVFHAPRGDCPAEVASALTR